jgi:hypothetical protein
MVCPHNSSDIVDQFFGILSSSPDGRICPDTVIEVTQEDSDAPVPLALKHPLTLRKCAEEYWDLNVSIKTDTFGSEALFLSHCDGRMQTEGI